MKKGYGYAIALCSAAFIGVNTVANKIVLSRGVDAMVAGSWTYACAAVVVIPLAIREMILSGKRQPVNIRLLVIFLLTGGIGGPVLYFLGLERTSAVHGSILNNLEAVFTALLAFGLFREPIGRRGIAGSIAVVAGSAWLSWPGPGQAAGGATVLGDILMALGFFSWAVEANLLNRIRPALPVFTVLAAKILTAFAAMTATAVVKCGTVRMPAEAIRAALVSGLLGLALSTMCFYKAISLIGAGRTGLILTMTSFFGTLGSVVFLGEPFHLSMLPPVTVIIAGLVALATERASAGQPSLPVT